ncbi:EFTUD2 [Symbiodinium sp. CCMP2456]|nr:EFTUD2 [Symbiodinium sp. CCMP2456]
MELDAQALQEGAANSEVLEYLHAEEQRLSDETRSMRNSEQAAFEEVEKQRSEMLSLKVECSAASVSVEHPPNEVVEHELRISLPPGHPALRLKRFDDLLAALELEKEEILEELREDSGLWQAQREVEEPDSRRRARPTPRDSSQSQALWPASPAGGGHPPPGSAEPSGLRLRNRRIKDGLAARCGACQSSWTPARPAEEVQRRIQQAGPAVAEVDDLHAQAAALEKENEILSRQQVEWHRSQNLMLRLAEEKKVPPNRPAESGRSPQAQGEPSASKRSERSDRGQAELEQVLSANETFRQRVRQLQEEKAELVCSQKGLESFIRSRMTAIETKLADNFVSSYPPSP